MISTFSLMAFYFFYFFQDFVYGPRFWFLLCPPLVLFIARAVSHPNARLSALFVILFVASFPQLRSAVARFDPSPFQAASLKSETAACATPKLVFIDPHIPQHFVNWNDPFLRSNVVLCRDLGTRNREAMRAFPDREPAYFRRVDSVRKTQVVTGFQFEKEPDSRPAGYVSLFDLAMAMQAGEFYPGKDMFDITYSDVFTAENAAEQYEYLQRLDSGGITGISEYQRLFRMGLLHAGRMLLLPKMAFERNRFDWQRDFSIAEFRREQEESMRCLRMAGDVGNPVIRQMNKVTARMDRNADGSVTDTELTAFLHRKILRML